MIARLEALTHSMPVLTAVPFLRRMPDTYHLAGHTRGTATIKFYDNSRELHQPGEKPQVAWSAQDGSRRRHAIAAAS